jgi:hypothetical protein
LRLAPETKPASREAFSQYFYVGFEMHSLFHETPHELKWRGRMLAISFNKTVQKIAKPSISPEYLQKGL